MDANYNLCFIIAHKYVIGYESYLKTYVDNINTFYPHSFIIIVDNNSDNLHDIVDNISHHSNILLLINNSNSKYELGAYIYALNWIINNKFYNFNYYIFSQDTLVLINKYDFNILINNNITACSMVEFNEKEMPDLYESFKDYTKNILEQLELYNCMDKITFCWGSNFIIHTTKIEQLFNYIKNIVLTVKRDSEAAERYMARIIYELNNHRNFNIDGFLPYYQNKNNCNFNENKRIYFMKKHQFKQ
jgi:hypothetical protein